MRHIGVTPHVSQDNTLLGGEEIESRIKSRRVNVKSIEAHRGMDNVFGRIEQRGGLRQFKLSGTEENVSTVIST